MILGLTVIQFVFAVVLLLLAIALIVLVLLQKGKDKKLSGAIAGGSDTYFGKSKAANKDKVLSVTTAVVAVVFTICLLAMYSIA